MSRVTDLLAEFIDHNVEFARGLGDPEPVVNPPATDKAWQRFHLAYPHVTLPADTEEFYRFANGITSTVIKGGLQRLPVDKPPSSWLCAPAPCPLDAQIPIVTEDCRSLVLLLEGDHRGEVWAGTVEPDALPHLGRVADSFTHILEQLVEMSSRWLEYQYVPVEKMRDAVGEMFPNVHPAVMRGFDVRSPQEIVTDGGYPPIYLPKASPEWEQAWRQIREREEEYDRRAGRWRLQNLPGYRPHVSYPANVPLPDEV